MIKDVEIFKKDKVGMEERKKKQVIQTYRKQKKLSKLNSSESMNKKFVNTQDHLHQKNALLKRRKWKKHAIYIHMYVLDTFLKAMFRI